MATHHVDLRRACPAPVGQWTPSPGERSAQLTLAQAERTVSKLRYCFYPRERLTVERANSIGVGKVQGSYKAILSKPGRNGNGERENGSSHHTPYRTPSEVAACGRLKPLSVNHPVR